MDLNILKEIKLHQVEMNRWKWYITGYLKENSGLPDFIIASMSIEEMIEYVLKETKTE